VKCGLTNNDCYPFCKYFDIEKPCRYQYIKHEGITIGLLYQIVSISAEKDKDDKSFLFKILTGEDLDKYIRNSDIYIDDYSYTYEDNKNYSYSNYKEDLYVEVKEIKDYDVEELYSQYKITEEKLDKSDYVEIALSNGIIYKFYPYHSGLKNYITIRHEIIRYLHEEIIEKYYYAKYVDDKEKRKEIVEFIKNFPDKNQANFYRKILKRELTLFDLKFIDFINFIVSTINDNDDSKSDLILFILLFLTYEYKPREKGEFPYIIDFDDNNFINNLVKQNNELPEFLRWNNIRIQAYYKLLDISPYYALLIYYNLSWIYLNYVWHNENHNLKEIYLDTVKLFFFYFQIINKFSIEQSSVYLLLNEKLSNKNLFYKLIINNFSSILSDFMNIDSHNNNSNINDNINNEFNTLFIEKYFPIEDNYKIISILNYDYIKKLIIRKVDDDKIQTVKKLYGEIKGNESILPQGKIYDYIIKNLNKLLEDGIIELLYPIEN